MIEKLADPCRRKHLPLMLRTFGPVALVYGAFMVWLACGPGVASRPLGEPVLSEAQAEQLVRDYVQGDAADFVPGPGGLRCGPNMSRRELHAVLKELGVPAEARRQFDGDWLISIESGQETPPGMPLKPWTCFGAVFLVKGATVSQVMGFMVLDRQSDWRQRFRRMLVKRWPGSAAISGSDGQP